MRLVALALVGWLALSGCAVTGASPGPHFDFEELDASSATVAIVRATGSPANAVIQRGYLIEYEVPFTVDTVIRGPALPPAISVVFASAYLAFARNGVKLGDRYLLFATKADGKWHLTNLFGLVRIGDGASADPGTDVRTSLVTLLRRSLTDPEPHMVRQALSTLVELRDSTAGESVAPLVSNPDDTVAAWALIYLISSGAPIDLSRALFLVEHSRSLEDGDRGLLAYQAINEYGAITVAELNTLLSSSKSELVRRNAAITLWRRADNTSVEVLLKGLEDPSEEIRYYCHSALQVLTKRPVADYPDFKGTTTDPASDWRSWLSKQEQFRAEVAVE